jgi:hypothetical protein
MFAFLVVALLLTLGAAMVGWFRPLAANNSTAPPSTPTSTDQQVSAAKASVCAACQQVRRALDVAGARNGGSDPTASLTVATASRQALHVGGRYLMTKLAEEPATNPHLATAVGKLADLYQQITVSYLADASDSEINPLRQAAEQPTATIDGFCK